MSLAAAFTVRITARLRQLLEEAGNGERTAAKARRDFFLNSGLSAEEVAHAHREALRVVRADIGTASLDACSDEPWPPEVLPLYEQALRMSGKGDPVGIEVDVQDDAQFEVMVGLAPYSIGVECWGRGAEAGAEVYGASDTGTGLCVALTPPQEEELTARLAALGVTGAFCTRS